MTRREAVRLRTLSLLSAACLALSGCTADQLAGLSPPPSPPTSAPVAPPPTTPGPTEPTTAATPWQLPEGTSMTGVFGSPWSREDGKRHAVAISALNLIDEVPKGATLLVSAFNITYPDVTEALIAAHRRGVEVHIVINHEATASAGFKRLRSLLGSDPERRSSIVVRGGDIRMHSKFILASTSGDRDHVVWMSSGNLTKASGRQQANEALTITGDADLYDFFAEQFALLAEGVTDPHRLARSITTATAHVQTFPLPEGGRENDPYAAMLDDITCVTDTGRTVLRLGQLYLTDQRLWVVEKLRELKASGCDVRVVGHLPIWETTRDLLIQPGPGQIDLRDSDGFALHTKITTIDGFDASGAPLKLLVAGSHNLTGRALTVTPDGVNDEFSVEVWDPATIDAYSAWVDLVIDQHSVPYRG